MTTLMRYSDRNTTLHELLQMYDDGMISSDEVFNTASAHLYENPTNLREILRVLRENSYPRIQQLADELVEFSQKYGPGRK